MDKIKDFLLGLLNFVGSSPFRLFTVVLLCGLGFGGWIVYSEKDSFMASYRAQQALPRMNTNYEQAVNFVLKNSDVELVALFEVNTLLNTRKLVYLTTRSAGVDKSYNGINVGLLTKNHSNNQDVIALMSGQIPCGPYLAPQSYIGFVYIFVTIYFCYLLYMGRIHPSNRFAIITLIFIGLIIAIKETFAHFSQCINSVNNKTTIPYCDNHYYKYWNCIHNEYYTSEEQE